MIRKFVAAFALMFLVTSTAFANSWSDGTDWDKGIVRVKGIGAGLHNGDKQGSFYRSQAREAARLDAIRNFVEEFNGTNAKPKNHYASSNHGRIKLSFSHRNRAFKLLKKSTLRVEHVRFYEDGSCEVDLEIILPSDWKK